MVLTIEMDDIYNADWLELIIALVAIVVLLLLCYVFSQFYSKKKDNHKGLIERTMQKRKDYFETHPDWGNKQQYNNARINERERNEGTNAANKGQHRTESELKNNSSEDYHMVSAQQGNVIVWENLQSIPKDSNSDKESVSDKNDDIIETECKYKFMQAAVEGRFLKLLTTSEKCFFRTWEERGERKYEFYGNEKKALANINAIFDDVCVIEGKQNGATVIENLSPGILDENLKIVKKATIKLT